MSRYEVSEVSEVQCWIWMERIPLNYVTNKHRQMQRARCFHIVHRTNVTSTVLTKTLSDPVQLPILRLQVYFVSYKSKWWGTTSVVGLVRSGRVALDVELAAYALPSLLRIAASCEATCVICDDAKDAKQPTMR